MVQEIWGAPAVLCERKKESTTGILRAKEAISWIFPNGSSTTYCYNDDVDNNNNHINIIIMSVFLRINDIGIYNF